ncbi:MAG: hypothetical protein HWN65_20075 [Candidatus Helarchaeota archaeon]|nr:hypothetical protein [Candidatus Helarchaeota archaeon]
MQEISYLLRVFIAMSAGIVANVGLLLQKYAINKLPEGEKVGKKLFKMPIWLLGIIIGAILGAVLFFLANTHQWGVGPGLVPGLSAFGLIIMAIGSIKLLKERINRQDILGILLMIGGIALLGLTELVIKVEDPAMLDAGWLLRAGIFTGTLVAISIFCQLIQKRSEKYRGILFTIFSGSMFAISNLWVAAVMGLFGPVFGAGQYIGLFTITSIILVVTNVVGIYKMQQAFQHGDASKLIPLQQLPIQIGPIFVYFAIFILIPPKTYSFPFMIIAIVLIIASSFFLGRRQAQLEEIK